MLVELRDVTKGRSAQALPATSLSFSSGTATLAVAETEQRPTVLGLIASGRMAPDTGTALIDGQPDANALRRRVALVDAPDVCDPAPNVTVAGVAAEELMFAGRPSNPVSVRRWLDANGFGALARIPIADVAPRERIALLLELTALRRGVEGIVLVSPDRHGGAPGDWWAIADGFADRGLAVLVVAGEASKSVLDALAPESSGEPEPVSAPELEPETLPGPPPHEDVAPPAEQPQDETEEPLDETALPQDETGDAEPVEDDTAGAAEGDAEHDDAEHDDAEHDDTDHDDTDHDVDDTTEDAQEGER